MPVRRTVVTVLADTAIRGRDLDEAKAQEALRAAEEHLKGQTDKLEIAKVQAEIAVFAAQLAAIKRLRK